MQSQVVQANSDEFLATEFTIEQEQSSLLRSRYVIKFATFRLRVLFHRWSIEFLQTLAYIYLLLKTCCGVKQSIRLTPSFDTRLFVLGELNQL